MTFNFAMQAIDQIINSAAKTFYMSAWPRPAAEIRLILGRFMDACLVQPSR